ncbi:MAG: fused MFS/spermidine synthase [Chloroflexota bacterium]
MRYLYTLVFTTGAVILGMELSASRLLEPAFGNNQIVWAALIGLILLYLALGAWLGGYLADRFPQRSGLDTVVTLGAVGVAIIPTFSTPVLRMAAYGLGNFALELLIGSLLAILLLFSIPGVLLGTASPWALRLAVRDLNQTGKIAGRLSAVATVGSLTGTFIPVLLLVPTFGTRWTFLILALILLLVVVIGSIRERHRWIPLAGLLVVLLIMAWVSQGTNFGRSIRAGWDDGSSAQNAGEIIYEDESLYNYIAVRQWYSERHLKLNDGVGIHSVYHPDSVLSKGIWDYFLLAPMFAVPPDTGTFDTGTFDTGNTENLLLIGLAAGTTSEMFTNIYGPLPITGVELDPQIIEVGQKYFGMTQPNLTAIAADGRRWLAQQPSDAKWDLIAVDAYRPPYIPFHLTTIEFFQLVHDHLSEDGMVAINVGRTASNYALVDTLTATLHQVFATIHIIDEPGPVDDLSNSLVVATVQPTTLQNFVDNAYALPDSIPVEFREFAQVATTYARTATVVEDAPIMTDDHAPIERIVHSIVFDFILGN